MTYLLCIVQNIRHISLRQSWDGINTLPFSGIIRRQYLLRKMYNIAKSSDCVLLPASARSKKAQWEVPRKANGWAYGFGQANVWYASEEDSRLQEYLTRLEKQIDEYNGENWIDKYAG